MPCVLRASRQDWAGVDHPCQTEASATEALRIQRAMVGDRGAFETLHNAYATVVYCCIRQHINTTADAQEIAQATWHMVWEKMSTYDPARGNFPAFVLFWARLMRRRYYTAMRKHQHATLLAQRLARSGQAGDEALLVPMMYEELLRLTLGGINPPHQTLAFGFSQLLEWTPREVVGSLSDIPLAKLAAMLETAYLQAVRPPAARLARLRSCFAPLHAAMSHTLDKVLCENKTRRTYSALLARTVGQTAFHNYYRDPGNQQQSAADITCWWFSVERRVKKSV